VPVSGYAYRRNPDKSGSARSKKLHPHWNSALPYSIQAGMVVNKANAKLTTYRKPEPYR
jgi:hypothetical protein